MRTTLLVSLAAAASLGIAFAAQAGDPSPANNNQAASHKKADDPDRIICHTEEKLGTRLPGKKTCHTKREWDEITEQAHQAMDSVATHQQGSPK